MSVGELLSAAFAMYKRHFTALVLSSLLLFGVSVALLLVFTLVFSALFASLLFASIVLAFAMLVIVWIVVSFIADVVGITFAGGQYRMLILAERERRVARVSDLWSALRYTPSFLAWAVVINVLALAAFLVILLGAWVGVQSGSNVLTYIILVAAVIALYWLTIRWVWVIPSIGDSGVSLIAAMRKSSLIVRQVGWWRTFGLLLLIIGINLGVYLLVNIVLTAAGDALPGLMTAVLGLAPLIVFIAPFETCFLTCMYRVSQTQAGLPDTFEPNPSPVVGGTGVAVRLAAAQVREAVQELKGPGVPQGSGVPAGSGRPSPPVGATAGSAQAGVPMQAPAAAPATGAAAGTAAASYAAFCGKCGTPQNGQARFCRLCGAGLERPAKA